MLAWAFLQIPLQIAETDYFPLQLSVTENFPLQLSVTEKYKAIEVESVVADLHPCIQVDTNETTLLS